MLPEVWLCLLWDLKLVLSGVRRLEARQALEKMTTIMALVTITLPGTKLAILLVIGSIRLEIIQPNCQPLDSALEYPKYWHVDLPFTIIGLLSMPISVSLSLEGCIYSMLECHLPGDPQTDDGSFIELPYLLLVPIRPKQYLNPIYFYFSNLFRDFWQSIYTKNHSLLKYHLIKHWKL